MKLSIVLVIPSLLALGCASPNTVHGSLQRIVWAASCDHATLGDYPRRLEDIRTVELDLGKDPWGRDYVYKVIEGAPVAICFGRDGKAGGFDENADRVWAAMRLELPPEVSTTERAWYVMYGTGAQPIPFRAN